MPACEDDDAGHRFSAVVALLDAGIVHMDAVPVLDMERKERAEPQPRCRAGLLQCRLSGAPDLASSSAPAGPEGILCCLVVVLSRPATRLATVSRAQV